MAHKKYTDKDRLSRRLGRYAQVTGTVGGLATRLVRSRFMGRGADQQAQAFREALGTVRGPLIKLVQMLATIPDALPQEYATELQQFQSNAPSMGWAFVRRRMRTELGPNWQDYFADFEREASAAASLGQVHRARLPEPDGRMIACKLQYPDMASVVEADLVQAGMVLRLFSDLDTREIHAEIAACLREELDYRREAQNIALYRIMLRDETEIHIPESVAALSTDRLLTMSWLAGEPLLKICDKNQEFRNTVAINMFRAWYVPFYHYGIIHGDPHLGNYSIRADGGINLLDFGCIRIFPPHFVKGVIDLYVALRTDDKERAIKAYQSWGFTDLTPDLIDTLNLWAQFVYRPLMKDQPHQMQETNNTAQGARVIAEIRARARKFGKIRLPREFVLLDRSVIGLGSVFIHLQANINWFRLFHDLITDFDVDHLAARQKNLRAQIGV